MSNTTYGHDNALHIQQPNCSYSGCELRPFHRTTIHSRKSQELRFHLCTGRTDGNFRGGHMLALHRLLGRLAVQSLWKLIQLKLATIFQQLNISFCITNHWLVTNDPDFFSIEILEIEMKDKIWFISKETLNCVEKTVLSPSFCLLFFSLVNYVKDETVWRKFPFNFFSS